MAPSQPRSLELSTLRMEAGLTEEQLLTFLGVTERTLRRWRVGGVPYWARTLLQVKAGYLDALGWPGWRMVKGEIYAPDLDAGFRRQDLYRSYWDRQLINALLPPLGTMPGDGLW